MLIAAVATLVVLTVLVAGLLAVGDGSGYE